jgi:hypothetical protein
MLFMGLGFNAAAAFARLVVNPGLEIIFNGNFEAQISRRIRAESRFLPGKSATAVSIYQTRIKQGAARRKSARSLRYVYFSP